MKKNNSSEVCSVVEFAGLLKVHPNTVRKAIKCGRIQAFRIGVGKRSSYRIYKYELERMAAFDATEMIEKIVKERTK